MISLFSITDIIEYKKRGFVKYFLTEKLVYVVDIALFLDMHVDHVKPLISWRHYLNRVQVIWLSSITLPNPIYLCVVADCWNSFLF